MVSFDKLRAFQDSLSEIGIGGNDLAIYLDSRPVYRYFSGFQNIEEQIPVNPGTYYRMFSMTKPITAVAALQLFEEGAFLLSDPVADYLPEFANVNVRATDENGKEVIRPAAEIMRVSDLFKMTAGFDYNLNSPSLTALYSRTGNQFTTREFMEALAKEPLAFEPDSHWEYSLCHDVLAALVERVSGVRYADYVQERIFTPLNMKSASFHPTKGQEMNYCIRYYKDPENGLLKRGDQTNPYQLSPNMDSGGAGSSMTVDDYARFACALTNKGFSKETGARILAPSTVDLMRTNTLDAVQLHDLYRSSPFHKRWGFGWGLAVRTLYDKAAAGTVASPGIFGWSGAWGTFVVMDPEKKLTLVYGEQGVDTKSEYIHRRLENFMYLACEYEGIL